MATPHIDAVPNDIAKTVLMPGDPLRSKFIADNFLENAKLFNNVRGVQGYTGFYKNAKVSVMASGMGMPAIGIYSYELFSEFEVENIIRVGSAGSYSKDCNVGDVLLVDEAYTESSFAKTQNGSTYSEVKASSALNAKISSAAQKLQQNLIHGKIHSSDVFYRDVDPKENPTYWDKLRDEKGLLACEMESFALFHNAKVLERNAACLLTISDSFVTGHSMPAIERQNSFDSMIKIALEAAIS